MSTSSGKPEFDEDEHDFVEGEESNHSQSQRSGSDRSFYSGDERSSRSGDPRSRIPPGDRSREGSHRSEESRSRSLRSDERSYYSGEDAYRSGDGSYRSGDSRSYSSREASQRSGGSRSYYSGEGSYRSGEPRSVRSGEESYISGESRSAADDAERRSFRSGDRSYHDGDGSSYRSGEGSYTSGDSRSFQSGDRSYRSGEGSYKSGGSRSFAEEEEPQDRSYRSGEGSLQSGDSRSRQPENTLGQESYASGESRSFAEDEGGQSFRSGEDSYISGEGSSRSGASRSFAEDEGPPTNHSESRDSFRSGEDSYRSEEGSYRSGESPSFAEEEGPPTNHSDSRDSYRSGEDSYRSEEESSRSGASRSFAEEEGPPTHHSDIRNTYRSGEDSHRSEESSYRSGESPSFAEEEGPPTNHSDSRDSYRSGEDSYRSEEGSYRSGESRSFGDDGQPSFHSDGQSCRSRQESQFSGSSRSDNDRSFFEEEGNLSSHSESELSRSGGGTSQAEKFSEEADNNHSFAEEVQQPIVNASLEKARLHASTGEHKPNPIVTDDETGESVSRRGNFPAMTSDAFDELPDDTFGGGTVSAPANVFGSDAFADAVFDGQDGTEPFAGFGFEADTNNEDIFEKTTDFDPFPVASFGDEDFGSFEKVSNTDVNDEDANSRSSKRQNYDGIPPGESTNSYSQEPGATTEPEVSKSGRRANRQLGTSDTGHLSPAASLPVHTNEAENYGESGPAGLKTNVAPGGEENSVQHSSENVDPFSSEHKTSKHQKSPISRHIRGANRRINDSSNEAIEHEETIHTFRESVGSKDRAEGSSAQSFYSEAKSQGSGREIENSFDSEHPSHDSYDSKDSQRGEQPSSYSSNRPSDSSILSHTNYEDRPIKTKVERSVEEETSDGEGRDGNSFYFSEGPSTHVSALFASGQHRDDKSLYSDDGETRSFASSQHSDDKSFYSEEGDLDSQESGSSGTRQSRDEKSFYSDEGDPDSNGSESFVSGQPAEENSFYSGERNPSSPQGSVSVTSSKRPEEKFFYSQSERSERSFSGNSESHSGSFRSNANSQTSASDRKSFATNEGSQGSHRSGEKSLYSEQRSRGHDGGSEGRSFYSGEGSQPMSHAASDELSLSNNHSNAEGSMSPNQSGEQRTESSLRSENNTMSSNFSDSPSKKVDDGSLVSGTISHVDDDPTLHHSQSEQSSSGQSFAEEESIGIGDVFGQPNELFERTTSSAPDPDENDASKKSESSQDDAVSDSNSVDQPSQDANESGLYSRHQEEKKENGASLSGDTSTKVAKPKIPLRPKEHVDPEERKRRKKRKKKIHREAKSRELLALVANVNDAMLVLEEIEAEQPDKEETSAHRLLHGFDALLGIYLQLSDELELISTFEKLKKKKKKEHDTSAASQALKAILSFAAILDDLFADLKAIILDCFEEDPDEEMDDMLYRLNALVDLLCETTHRVGEKQEWNERAETTYVTLLELMEREATELISYFEDVDVPEQGLTDNIHEAWSATGHIEELRALRYATDPWLFRQLCYEVMVSTDQWCPDTTILMEICGIDPSLLEEEPDSGYLAEEEIAPVPQAAEHVLDKVYERNPLPRTTTLASILRRILPPRAITDATLLDNFTSIRNTRQNPLGLSATNIVSISSIPEQPNDPDSLGVGGMGKTTLAAMVAHHPDVRRFFIDGVVWVYVGDRELNYNRYTQCLRELVSQLDFYQGVPLFAELLHSPGESLSKRRRREEGFMIYARDTIAELLIDRSVLIILDDVCFEPDLDWFDFAPMPGDETDEMEGNCALLVTTRRRTLLPAADTVEVDMLDEADAISLLIQESGQLSHTLMAESREARSVVRECANHPLAVKSVGRWLNLKHATAGVVNSVEEIHSEVIKSMDKILQGGDHTGTDMMYEILSMSLSPAINGEPTNIIKFCLAAFITVFCDKEYISDFAMTEPAPIIPMDMAELLFETLLEMNESSLLQKGSLFYAQKKEAAVLIPEALSALGVLKVITYSDAEGEDGHDEDEQKYLQFMHFVHHEYGEYLCHEEEALKHLTQDAERQWNRALVEAYTSQAEEWDINVDDAGHSYALEMIISHMIRGGMYSRAADLLADKSFVRGRILLQGRENSTKRHIKDCEMLFKKLKERRPKGSKLEPRHLMKQAYQALGSQLSIDDGDSVDERVKDVEIARAHYEIGFSLAEKRCWDAAIAHWETSQELLVASLGTVEIVAGILFNIGVVYSEMNEYEQALDSLKQCLRIRGTIHGESHILYAQTIQKIGDIFLGMSDYHEAIESYNWALDVMYTQPNIHRVEIGEILDNKGIIHYSKGEIDEALQCHQEALRSKQVELGEDHPELATTYHHIGNCLSDQGNVEDAIVHFEEAIRLKELDPEGGPERDADVLTIEGVLYNLEGNQEQGLECYEKSLQILVTKVPHRKEKVASLLHLVGCVYLMSGEQKKAMKLFEESLQARRKVLGFVHLDVASTLFNMAFLHQTRNRLDKALKCLEEALKIRQLRLPDSEKVAVTHGKIGSLARAIGKTKKAQINFEDALRIRRLIHGERHEAVAIVLQELGDLMDELGEYDSAMSYYIDALDIRRRKLGLDDVAVADTLYSMAYTLHNNDEPDQALVCFEEALNIRRHQLGDDSKEVGDTLNMMGFLKAKRGDLDDALTLLWDALRIRKLNEDHVKVSETLKNIGNVHREKNEHDLAVECYEECLRIRRDELGPDNEKVADALIAMGNVQSDMNHKEEAMRSYQEALKIRTMVFGEHDESVAAVLQYMGTMEFRAGNYDKARDLLTEFIRIRRENGTKNDGDYVNVLFIVGNIHKMHNREDDAQLCWSEAYQVFQELGLAESNPQIAKVMNHLLKQEEEKEAELKKKKAKVGNVIGKMTEKLKGGSKDKMTGKKRRKGKGIQL